METTKIEDIKVGDQVLTDFKDYSGGHNFIVVRVLEVDLGDNSIVINVNGGLDLYPDNSGCYVVIND